MNILGIDSSGLVASVAVLSGESIAAEFTVNNKQTHSQTLLPMIEQVVNMSGIALEELDAIAVASGPGSFTGLRIGAATVKGLGLVLDKPIIPVPTLEGLAYRLAGMEGVICPLMDARRNQVYTGIYRVQDCKLEVVLEQEAVDIHEIISKLNGLGERVTVLGDGVPVQRETLEKELTVSWQEAPIHLSRQNAAAVVTLASIYWKEGKSESAAEHRPEYLRKSQAERERENSVIQNERR